MGEDESEEDPVRSKSSDSASGEGDGDGARVPIGVPFGRLLLAVTSSVARQRKPKFNVSNVGESWLR